MSCTLTTVLQTRDSVSKPWTNNKSELFPYRKDELHTSKLAHPFRFSHLQVHGFLSNVYNWSGIPSLTDPRGLPSDIKSGWEGENLLLERGKHHVFSYVEIPELLRYDYDRVYFDILFNKDRTVRTALDLPFFDHLFTLTNLHNEGLEVRVVMSFNY